MFLGAVCSAAFLVGAAGAAPGGRELALLIGSTVCCGITGGGVGGGIEIDLSDAYGL